MLLRWRRRQLQPGGATIARHGLLTALVCCASYFPSGGSKKRAALSSLTNQEGKAPLMCKVRLDLALTCDEDMRGGRAGLGRGRGRGLCAKGSALCVLGNRFPNVPAPTRPLQHLVRGVGGEVR